ncbi:MAG: hypothetical protein PHP52_08460 [Bacteroidales bacterium]|nr:hypothetical protein [Bacteroidales bacterium]MDD4215936.1 hypothetical protein [Bacteroidales bacterium]MDY0141048.1 hypothetical protein [Bacteroidales bacterium]
MKNIFNILFFVLLTSPIFSQSYNSKAIEINNNLNANYQIVSGTNIQMSLPNGFVKSTNYNGFTHKIAGTSIVITELPGDVNRNFLGFDKKSLFKSGVILDKTSFYKINGFDAMLIEGKQSAYNRVYTRIMLVVGDIYRSYLISASVLSTASDKHKQEVKDALLSVYYDTDMKSDMLDRFDFSVDVSGTILKKGNLMFSSMTFTDDGFVPSNTANKTSFMIRHQTAINPISNDEKKTLCVQLFDLYPLEWVKDMSREPKSISINNLSGYEIFSMGKNKELYKMELIYQVVLFNGQDYYVLVGITYGDFEENLRMFKKVAKTFKSGK